MNSNDSLSRRGFLALTATSAATLRAQEKAHVPVGVLLYAVQRDLNNDFSGTLSAVAKMGYEGVEFTQYFAWTPARAKEIRAQLDDLHIRCFSTHNEAEAFTPDGLKHAIEVNQILGSQSIVAVRGLAQPGDPVDAAETPKKGPPLGFSGTGMDGWKRLSDLLQQTAEQLRSTKLTCAFHNHAVEFVPVDGVKPIDILGKAKDVAFHIDVNVCIRAKSDPVAFMRQYPGRVHSLLLTDGPPDANRHAPLLGKGTVPWKDVFATAESKGGIRFYLITHGATDLTPLETIHRDLDQYRQIHG